MCHLDVQDEGRNVLPVVVYLPHGTSFQAVETVEEHLKWLQMHEPDWAKVDLVIDFADYLWIEGADEIAGAGLRAWIQQIIGGAA